MSEVITLEESLKMGSIPVDEYLTGHVFKEDIEPEISRLRSKYPGVKFYLMKSYGYYRIRAEKILSQYELIKKYTNSKH